MQPTYHRVSKTLDPTLVVLFAYEIEIIDNGNLLLTDQFERSNGNFTAQIDVAEAFPVLTSFLFVLYVDCKR